MTNSKNRDMVYKVLTDPKFRKQLETDPAKAVGKKELTAVQKREVKKILSMADQIHKKIDLVADQLLCANGGGCGIGIGARDIKDKKVRR
ncbi:MAG: hypothetical protein WC379_16165 [Methanoregula sp.]